MSPFPDLTAPLPSTHAGWRLLARLTAGLLLIADARELGLIAGGPDIDRGRCDEILVLAAAQGIIVEIDEASLAAVELAVAINDEIEAEAGADA